MQPDHGELTPGEVHPQQGLPRDYARPLQANYSCVKKGPRIHKMVYCVLFTCACSRAVVLDIANDYSTQSVLHCVRRLMADSVQVAKLISDTGTNLRGAAMDLQEPRRGWDEAELIRPQVEVCDSCQSKSEWGHRIHGEGCERCDALSDARHCHHCQLNTLMKEIQNLGE